MTDRARVTLVIADPRQLRDTRLARRNVEQARYGATTGGADHADITAIADLVTTGQLQAVIDGAFPLAAVAKAHELGDTGHVAGKLVLTME